MNLKNEFKNKKYKTMNLQLVKNEPSDFLEIERQPCIIYKKRARNREFDAECRILIIENTLISNASLLCDEQSTDLEHQLLGVMKNLIILHGKDLTEICIEKLSRYFNKISNNYIKSVLFKMLHNIKSGNSNDNIAFRDVSLPVIKLPPIPAEDRIYIEKNLPHYNYSRQLKKIPPKFKVGQIVGAKDKENKWWLSRVLHVYDTPQKNSYWYYIRFEGWGKMHDEWICSNTYRVRYFNPHKHFLKK